MLLQGKKAIITGGSRGIGKAIAAAFLREGAEVMLSARSPEELASAKRDLVFLVPSHVEGESDKVRTRVADVSKEADAKALVSAAVKEMGGVDILVNAAGIFGPIGPLEKADLGAWKKTFEINVFGMFGMIQAVAPVMVAKKRGKIVNLLGGGDGSLPRFSAYSASKGAVARLTETSAAELKEHHIEVNAIAPGPVNTKFLDDALAAGPEAVGVERYKTLEKQKKEGGTPPELAADLCVFLASSAADGLTGKIISAKWDDYKNWDKKKIEEIMGSDAYTLRRVKPR